MATACARPRRSPKSIKRNQGGRREGALSFSLSHYGPSYPSLTVALHIRVPGLRSTAATSRDHRSSTRYIDAGYINPPPSRSFDFEKRFVYRGTADRSSTPLQICERSDLFVPAVPLIIRNSIEQIIRSRKNSRTSSMKLFFHGVFRRIQIGLVLAENVFRVDPSSLLNEMEISLRFVFVNVSNDWNRFRCLGCKHNSMEIIRRRLVVFRGINKYL